MPEGIVYEGLEKTYKRIVQNSIVSYVAVKSFLCILVSLSHAD